MKYTIEDELEEQSSGPHGVVADSECLLRVLHEPEHIADGVVIPAAISSRDLRERGFSVDRIDFADRRCVERLIEKQQYKDPGKRQDSVLSCLQCSSVRRATFDETDRMFIVVDHALEDNSAHASIWLSRRVDKKDLLRAKQKLANLLQRTRVLGGVFHPLQDSAERCVDCR